MTPAQWELGTKEVKLHPLTRTVIHRLATWCEKNDAQHVTLDLLRACDSDAKYLERGDGPYRNLLKHGLLRRVRIGVYELALPWHLTPDRRWTPAMIERMSR